MSCEYIMSKITDEQANAAFSTLYNELHAPVFFHKLASDFGIAPQNADETADLLALGGKLRYYYLAKQAEQASAGTSLLKRANAHLDKLLTGAGVTPAPSAVLEREVKAAAARVAANPTYASAILTLQTAVAQKQAA